MYIHGTKTMSVTLLVCPNTPPDAETAFQHWLQTCRQDPWTPLNPDAAKPYGFIWNAWLKHLAGQPDKAIPWHEATSIHLLSFINQTTKSHHQGMPSDITRRRYWRVLDRLYDHALIHNWLQINPAQALTSKDMPPSEDPHGAILSPRIWRALQAQIPVPVDLISCRDRAILMLLMELGLTPEEVRLLTMNDLRFSTVKPSHIQSIHIQGERERQSRMLTVSPALAHALSDWLAARNAYHAMQGQLKVFCTRKAPELSTHTLLHLVSKTLRQAVQVHQLPPPARMGPQVIRNTVLVQWLENGASVDTVLTHFGLKHPNALLHLRAYFS